MLREGSSRLLGAATPLADWGRPGRLRSSLWLKGPAARGPYWRLSWMTLRPAWQQCRAGRGMAEPYGVLWPCVLRDSGGGRLYCSHAPSHRRYVGTVLVGAVLAGFWEPAFFMAGFWELAFLMAAFQ